MSSAYANPYRKMKTRKPEVVERKKVAGTPGKVEKRTHPGLTFVGAVIIFKSLTSKSI